MIQLTHRFDFLLRGQSCLNPVWLGGLRSLVCVPLSTPAKLDSTNFGKLRRTKPALALYMTVYDILLNAPLLLTVTLCSPVPGCVKRSTWTLTSPTGSSCDGTSKNTKDHLSFPQCIPTGCDTIQRYFHCRFKHCSKYAKHAQA